MEKYSIKTNIGIMIFQHSAAKTCPHSKTFVYFKDSLSGLRFGLLKLRLIKEQYMCEQSYIFKSYLYDSYNQTILFLKINRF
jgi:hypothetical protein